MPNYDEIIASMDANYTASILDEVIALLPKGWVVVPAKPTAEMLNEIRLDKHHSDYALKTRYQALLEASRLSPCSPYQRRNETLMAARTNPDTPYFYGGGSDENSN